MKAKAHRIPETPQMRDLHQIHVSFRTNVKNVGKKCEKEKSHGGIHLIGSALMLLQIWFYLEKKHSDTPNSAISPVKNFENKEILSVKRVNDKAYPCVKYIQNYC